MKTLVYQIITGLLLVSTLSCQQAPEHTTGALSVRERWEQDPIAEIYEDNKPVPTLPIFNCRLNSSETSQRYFSLKVNKNYVEKSISAEGVETTLYRRASFRHFVKNMKEENVIYFEDSVIGNVDVTVKKLANNKTQVSITLSPKLPFELNLHAPEGSDIVSIKDGEEFARVMWDETVKNQISIETKHQILGEANTQEQPAECEFVNL